MVFQTDALFDSLTVLDNVLLPLRRRRVPEREARTMAEEVLAAVGLSSAAATFPERLSGGMRKRTGLARAVVARPQVLLADDPLAGLDPATAKQVCQVLEAVSTGRTLIIAAPEPLPFLELPRWLYLKSGRIIHDAGPASELLDRDVEETFAEAAPP
jgi:phospholipid/cholesterol/gamma-HCH transport system ATP-binding protein